MTSLSQTREHLLASRVRSPRALRRLLRLCSYGAFGFAAAITASVTVPVLAGYQPFTVLSGSMAPTIGVGDVVVVKRIAPLDARVADVVTFPSPDHPSRLVTHRVVRMRASHGRVSFETRGDANTGLERWSVAQSGRIGRAVYRIPKLGYAANYLGSRLGRLGFLVVPAILLGVLELKRIWRPARGRPDDQTEP